MANSVQNDVGRTASFQSGMIGGNSIATSLDQVSARQNSRPKEFSPNSVLQQYMLSPGNGNSSTDAARQIPGGQLPSPNDGISKNTYSQRYPSNFSTKLTI